MTFKVKEGASMHSYPVDQVVDEAVKQIIDEMFEPKPLPMGRQAFEEWSNRIISGALIPMGADADPVEFLESQKFALASLIMQLGPTESHKCDAHFIHSLRKAAINQVAHAIGSELKEASKERNFAKELARVANEDE